MGIFSKIGGGIKHILQRGGSIVKDVVKKAAPVVYNIAQKGTSLLSHVPGTIGTVAGLANKGLNVAKNLVENIPNSKAKEALTNVINKGQSAVNTGQNHATNLTNRVSSVANPILQTTSQVAKKLM